MTENTVINQAFKLKGRLFTLTVFQVLSVDKDLLKQQCIETVKAAPNWFDQTPIVFDLTAVAQQDCDIQSLSEIVRTFGMIPVALVGASAAQASQAKSCGLALLMASSSQDRSLQVTKASAKRLKSKLVNTPVRSGQQVLASGTDLIITSSVSHGSELLADGNIHVYGVLRGRALAGCSGDVEARIFCQSFEAELVSIAGFYRLSENLTVPTGPCVVYLSDGQLLIESVC
jgi:septum site-determining protein MinC